MIKFVILSLVFAVVAAAPAHLESEDTRLFNALIESANPNEIDDLSMLEHELDNELDKLRELDFIPDKIRDQIIEKLRMTALQIKIKIDALIVKMDNEITKLEDAYQRTGNAFYKSKLWTQINSLKLLRTVTQAGLDKFDKYIVSEDSDLLEKLIRTLEKLFEAKFFKFSVLARASLKLLESMELNA